ncbi:MAG: hypothetical protein WC242_03800 [Candidatus Paceibacterota bacterium]|jgi:hypothetical protein
MKKSGMRVTEVSSGYIRELNLEIICSKHGREDRITIVFERGKATLNLGREQLMWFLAPMDQGQTRDLLPPSGSMISVTEKTKGIVRGKIELSSKDAELLVLRLLFGNRKTPLYKFAVLRNDIEKIRQYVKTAYLYLGRNLSELGIVPEEVTRLAKDQHSHLEP